MNELQKKIFKHRDLIIDTNDQVRINASAKKIAIELQRAGFKESYEELLEMLGYHEVKVKKIEKRKK